ncbi:MAG: RNA polymerase sigma factor [Oscillibacter sp.]|nr:RNA polymerase sigma factor [Oscillibacter sp.]
MTETQLRNAMTTYGDTVYRLALCRMQNVADAEDVYQDVFLRLFRQETDGWVAERVKAWLLRTAVNRCNDLHRFRLRRSILPLEEVPDMAAPEDDAAELWAAVAQLPPKLRTVIHLHYAEGYATEEIAVILDIPPATVRTRLHRGRLRLKELLGGMDHES